jgi:hypothetical protein
MILIMVLLVIVPVFLNAFGNRRHDRLIRVLRHECIESWRTSHKFGYKIYESYNLSVIYTR